MCTKKSNRSSSPAAKHPEDPGAPFFHWLTTTAADLQSMLDAIQETAGIVDRRGKLLLINETGARRYGMKPVDMTGLNLFDSREPLWKARAARLREVIRRGQPVSFEDVRNGRLYRNSMYPIRDGSGPVARVAVVGIDVTAERKAQEQIRAADERFRQVLQQSADGVLLADPRGAIVEFNTASEVLFGVRRESVLGRTSRELASLKVPRESSAALNVLCSLLQRATEGPYPSFSEDILEMGNGRAVHIETMWSKIRHGSSEAYAAFIRNVSQLREAQRSLAAANQALEQKNAALREILAHIEEEKARVEERVQTHVEAVLLPLFHRLRLGAGGRDQTAFSHFESHLRDLARAVPRRVHASLTALTARELELAEMIKRDLSNKEIAQLLRLSPRTVELHRTRIRKKLGLTGEATRLSAYLRSL